MAVLLALFVIGMPFFSVVNLTVRAFYSVKDTATPVKVAVIDFTVNLGAEPGAHALAGRGGPGAGEHDGHHRADAAVEAGADAPPAGNALCPALAEPRQDLWPRRS